MVGKLVTDVGRKWGCVHHAGRQGLWPVAWKGREGRICRVCGWGGHEETGRPPCPASVEHGGAARLQPVFCRFLYSSSVCVGGASGLWAAQWE